jgi:hypothetical protein
VNNYFYIDFAKKISDKRAVAKRRRLKNLLFFFYSLTMATKEIWFKLEEEKIAIKGPILSSFFAAQTVSRKIT